MKILEVLQNALYNMQYNGSLGVGIAKEQLENAIEQLADGEDVYQDFKEEK